VAAGILLNLKDGGAMEEQNHVFGAFVFDRRRRILLKRGSPVSLGQKCVALLEVLLAAEGRAVSKSELMEAAWQTENIEESNLAVQIAALRKRLSRSRRGDEWITTVQRVGYQFVHPGEGEEAPLNHDSNAIAQTPSEGPSVAVLPFTNMSSDPEQQYFSDGVSEDIIQNCRDGGFFQCSLARPRSATAACQPTSSKSPAN
jgi:DNA-binding winged helix-turn-helix (wHTH) protein